MKKLLIATAAAVMLACVAMAAQQPTFYAAIDYPAQGANVKQSQFFVGGWAFNCATGEHPVFAYPDLVNIDTGQRYAMESFWQKDHLLREDVRRVYSGICPNVSLYSGVHTYITPQPPPGRYRVRITWDDGGYVYGLTRDFTIVP